MKMKIGILAFAAILASAGVQANCRSGDAARLGSDAGLARDRAAAIQTAEQDRSNSDTLGQCISGITSIQVAPTFPSLMDIFNQAARRICRLASDAIPRGGNVAGTGISTTSGQAVPAQLSGTIGSSPARPTAGDFWSRIWR